MGSGKGKQKRVNIAVVSDTILSPKKIKNNNLISILNNEYKFNSYSEEELDLLTKYIWNGTELNNWIHKGVPVTSGSAYTNDDLDEEAKKLNKLLLKHQLPNNTMLYRGVKAPRWLPENYEEIQDLLVPNPGFTSTSIFSNGAMEFTKAGKRDGLQVIIEITCNNTSGVWLDGATKHKFDNFLSEHEVLLARNQSMLINKFMGKKNDPKIGEYLLFSGSIN